ncbi:MAG: hypothetical protein ACXACP_01515 [Candidatus Hodarchaeales archaeon]
MTIIVCPNCRFANKSDNKICSNCGFDFEGSLPERSEYQAIRFAPEQTVSCLSCNHEFKIMGIGNFQCPQCEYKLPYNGPFRTDCYICGKKTDLNPKEGSTIASCKNCGQKFNLRNVDAQLREVESTLNDIYFYLLCCCSPAFFVAITIFPQLILITLLRLPVPESIFLIEMFVAIVAPIVFILYRVFSTGLSPAPNGSQSFGTSDPRICPECRFANKNNSITCSNCGHDFEDPLSS